eukprot:COSAG05_NODE_23171_length_260_cov_0.298137_1_plen_41_part_01
MGGWQGKMGERERRPKPRRGEGWSMPSWFSIGDTLINGETH